MVKRKTKKRKRSRRNKYKGGAVSMEFETPTVNATTPSQALDGAQHDQKINAEKVVELNKAMAGGSGIVVPQMGIAAGEEGNNSIASSISSTLKGRADGEFDTKVCTKPPQQLGGKRKSKKKKGGKLDDYNNHMLTTSRNKKSKTFQQKKMDLKTWHTKNLKDKRDGLKNMGRATRNIFEATGGRRSRRRKSRRRKSRRRKSRRRKSRRRSRRKR